MFNLKDGQNRMKSYHSGVTVNYEKRKEEDISVVVIRVHFDILFSKYSGAVQLSFLRFIQDLFVSNFFPLNGLNIAKQFMLPSHSDYYINKHFVSLTDIREVVENFFVKNTGTYHTYGLANSEVGNDVRQIEVIFNDIMATLVNGQMPVSLLNFGTLSDNEIVMTFNCKDN